MVAPELGAAHLPPRGPAGDQLAGRLGVARDDGFVGRGRELELLSDALTGTSDIRVMFVHGPGGIGKTTLLDAMARRTRTGGRQVTYLDGRDVECSPAAVLAAVRERTVDDPSAVLLVDGYELLTPLDRWFRTEFLPARPADAVTVVAGREAPAAAWWLDPGWRRLVSVHGLEELDAADSRDLLLGLGVTDQVDRLAELGRGYPLALAMLAEVDRSGRRPDQLSDAPDAVGQLCALILDDVPDDAHRTGLATCAHATRTTQDLLTRMIGSRAPEVWAWLESRPYVRQGALGLYVHDVVRELFEAELAHRSPAEYTQLHRAVRGYFQERMVDRAEPHPDRAAAEVLLLHRKTPLAAETSVLRDRGQLSVPRAGPAEREEIIALIETHEGSESADLARRWLTAQPRSAYHCRADDGTAAFAVQVYLPGPGDLMADDPIAAAIWKFVSDRGPLRPGERVNVNRFAGADHRYQGDPLQLLVNGVSCILEWRTTPAAWTFIVSFGVHYGAYFDYLGLTPMLKLDVGGAPVTLFGWDRRQFPASAFFEMMETRELTGETGPPPAELLRPLPLTRTSFDAAVRAALRRLTRAGGLDSSELLTSALVPPDATDPPATLNRVLREAVADLDRERGGAEHRRVLERTFLAGAPSQEAAAELLDLPFSTYRRHLARATDRLVEVLWAIELEPNGSRRT
ncbi:ATP-binding protein [Microlunatus aurantiacus]|uniref:ATP-binding protein n=1 Tax=Microlunatus aurantiacus TaxID=446786 RepID=A0ABP7DDX2_9ACTN